MSYRNAALLALANGVPCTLCGARGTTVACHANQVALGKGTGIKSPDYFIAYCCHRCHNQIDGREGTLSRAERHDLWNRGFQRTVALWFEAGFLVVTKRRRHDEENGSGVAR